MALRQRAEYPKLFLARAAPLAKNYNANGPLIGEIWSNASQWLAGDQMDSVMNYRFRRNVTGFVRWPYNWVDTNDNGNDAIIPLTPSQFDTANRAVRDDYPPQATAAMLNLIDSHDTNRALYVMTELGDTGLVQAKQRLKLAALFQFTYIGAPTVFYGDEAAINAPSLANDGQNVPAGRSLLPGAVSMDRSARQPNCLWAAGPERASLTTRPWGTCANSTPRWSAELSSRWLPATRSRPRPRPIPTRMRAPLRAARRPSWR